MQPTILPLGQITLLGLSFYGDPFAVSGDWDVENEIGRLWQRLGASLQRYPHLQAQAARTYEVHIHTPETAQKGYFEVFSGIESSDPSSAPLDMLIKVLPAGPYARFTLRGEQFISDWYTEIEPALAQAGYRRKGEYFFQLYDARFISIERIAESELDVYIPVEPLTRQ